MVVPFPALLRFLRRAAVLSLLIGVPAAVAAYLLSGRSEPVYSAEATLLAPLRALSVDLPSDVPTAGNPMPPLAYGSALRGTEVLADAWQRLNPDATREPSVADIEELAAAVGFRIEERPRSMLLMIATQGVTPAAAMARSAALTTSLLAWDDNRARAEATSMVAQLEARLAALEQQLRELRLIGGRAVVPQINSLSLLAVELRQSLAEARSLTVAARGNLELLQPGTRPVQLRPSPFVNAAVALGLSVIVVVGVLLVQAGRDRRIHTAAGLAEVSGLPLLAAFSEPPDLNRQRRSRSSRVRSDTALPYLKAQVDRAMTEGGKLLVVPMSDTDSSEAVASALADLYEVPGSITYVSSAPPLTASGVAFARAAAAAATIVVADPKQTDRLLLVEAIAWLKRADANVLGIVASPSTREPVRDGRAAGPGSGRPGSGRGKAGRRAGGRGQRGRGVTAGGASR